MIFIGNIPLDVNTKTVKKLFNKELGGDHIEAVWFRSVPTNVSEDTMKVPRKAKIITKDFGE